MTINLSALTIGEVVYANGNFNYFNGTKLIPINTGISDANAAIAILKAQVAKLISSGGFGGDGNTPVVTHVL